MRQGVRVKVTVARFVSFEGACGSAPAHRFAGYGRLLAATVTALIALSACASKPEIAIQSYCAIKATELIDMRDRGIRGLSVENKRAVLAGDDNWLRECKLGDRTNSGGPR